MKMAKILTEKRNFVIMCLSGEIIVGISSSCRSNSDMFYCQCQFQQITVNLALDKIVPSVAGGSVYVCEFINVCYFLISPDCAMNVQMAMNERERDAIGEILINKQKFGDLVDLKS